MLLPSTAEQRQEDRTGQKEKGTRKTDTHTQSTVREWKEIRERKTPRHTKAVVE